LRARVLCSRSKESNFIARLRR